MRKYVFGFLVAVAIATFAIACRPPVVYQQEYYKFDQVVVRVDTIFQLTMADLYDSLYHCQEIEGGGIISAEQLAPILDSLVLDSLIGLSADDIRLEDDYVEYRVFRKRMENLMRKRYLKYRIYDRIDADSAEIAAFYYEREDLHKIPEQVLLWQILISPNELPYGPDSAAFSGLTGESLEQAAEDYVRDVQGRIESAEQFEEAARMYSHDLNVGVNGGRVGWTPRGYYLDPFDSVAFNTPPGEVCEPYRDASGWHIVFIEKHEAEGIPSLDSAQYQLAKQNLYTTMSNELHYHVYDSVMSLPLEIVYNEQLLDTNLHLVDPGVWAATFNEVDTIEFYDLRGMEERFRTKHHIDNTTVEMKREMIQNFSTEVLLLQTARGASIDTLPDVVAEEARLRHRHSKAVAKRALRDPYFSPSDSMIQAYFDSHPEEFSAEIPFVLQQMVVSDSSLGLFLRDQALSGQDFFELARQYHEGDDSDPATKIDIGPVTEADVMPEIWKQIMATAPGGVSEPTKTEYGYHLVKVVERNYSRDIGQAAPVIRTKLLNDHIRGIKTKVRDSLYLQYDVSFPNKLRAIHLRPNRQRLAPLNGAQ